VNSANYSGRYSALALWNVPIMPRFRSDQKFSMLFVWTLPQTYTLIPMLDDFMRIVAQLPIGRMFVGRQ
jgi:hypothetical protein